MSKFTGLITDEFIQLNVDMITETIRACSVPCQLIYGVTKYDDCPNCILDLANGTSTNRWQSGGPSPFTVGACPMCAGAGKIPQENYDTLDLCPVYDYKSWIKTIAAQVQSPDGFVQTMSLFCTYEQIRQAKEIIINTDITTNVRSRFERYGEPEPCGMGQASFIATMWKRIENV